MKHGLLCTLGLIVLVMVAFAASPAGAQTTANGPYYATPSWDQTLPSSTRFIVLSNFGGAAVLDRETGLVWERSPATDAQAFTWNLALGYCIDKNVGGRKGWRLPFVNELASLIDPSVHYPGPTLPAGHPFTNVQTSSEDVYWSATTNAPSPYLARFVSFAFGFVGSIAKDGVAGQVTLLWCVRSGAVLDNY